MFRQSLPASEPPTLTYMFVGGAAIRHADRAGRASVIRRAAVAVLTGVPDRELRVLAAQGRIAGVVGAAVQVVADERRPAGADADAVSRDADRVDILTRPAHRAVRGVAPPQPDGLAVGSWRQVHCRRDPDGRGASAGRVAPDRPAIERAVVDCVGVAARDEGPACNHDVLERRSVVRELPELLRRTLSPTANTPPSRSTAGRSAAPTRRER